LIAVNKIIPIKTRSGAQRIAFSRVISRFTLSSRGGSTPLVQGIEKRGGRRRAAPMAVPLTCRRCRRSTGPRSPSSRRSVRYPSTWP
jgi:hypothetical protein